MKIITSGEIVEWASRDVAVNAFPSMVRNLIRFTTNASLEGFHAYNANNRPGVDGKTILKKRGTKWVPRGVAYWEIGVVEDNQKKAQDDYRKRTNEVPNNKKNVVPKSARRSASFVYVTPKNWKGGKDWAEEKKQLKEWKDVIVIDAESIEQWIEQLSYPQYAKIADIMGKDIRGIGLLEHAWKTWSEVTSPPLPESMFEQDIHRAVRSRIWNNWKKGEKNRIAEVCADSIDEGLAFLYCLFKHEKFKEYEDKVYIARDEYALQRGLAEKNSIVVIDEPSLKKRLGALGDGVRAICVTRSGMGPNKDSFLLSNLDIGRAEQIMREMGHRNDSYEYIRDFAGKSKGDFRRRLASEATIQEPEWSNEYQLLIDAIPLICLSSWNSNSELENDMIERLGGAGYHRVLKRYVSQDGSPIREKEGVFRLSSLTEILEYFVRNVNLSDVVALVKKLKFIILNQDNREMIKSAYNALIILDVCKARGTTAARRVIDAAVDEIVESENTRLQTKSGERQWRLSQFAELGPARFLDCISIILKSNEQNEVEKCFFQEVLQAIKVIAFNQDYFSRCIDLTILLLKCKLVDEQYEGVKNTLKSFFCCWFPQTNATAEIRNDELTKLFNFFPAVAWDVALEQVNPYPRSATRNLPAVWRDKKKWQKMRGVTYEEENLVFDFCFNKILENLDLSYKGIYQMLDYTSRYDEKDYGDLFGRVWLRLTELSTSASDVERLNVQGAIKRFMCRVRYKEGKSEMHMHFIDKAQHILKLYLPQSALLQKAWLFQCDYWQYLYLPLQNGRTHIDIEKIVDYLRKRVYRILDITSTVFMSDLLNLENLDAYRVGESLSEYICDRKQQIEVLNNIIRNEEKVRDQGYSNFVLGYMRAMSVETRREVIQSMIDSDANEKFLTLLIDNLPCDEQTWSMVTTCFPDLQERYWKNVKIYIRDIERDEKQVILRNFLKNGRHLEILNIIRFILDEKYQDIRKSLLSLIYKSQLKAPHFIKYHEEYSVGVLISSLNHVMSDFERMKLGVRFYSVVEHTSYIEDVYYPVVARRADLFVLLLRYYYTHRGADAKNYVWESNLENIFHSPGFLQHLVQNCDVIHWLNQVKEHADNITYDPKWKKYVCNRLGEMLSRSIVHAESFEKCRTSIFGYLNNCRSHDLIEGVKKGVFHLHRERHGYSYNKELADCDAEDYRNLSANVRKEYPNFADMLNDLADDLTDMVN